MRLPRKQQREILFAMLEEARDKTAKGFSLKEVVQHIAHVRDDMKSADYQGVIVSLARDQDPRADAIN